MRQILTLCGVLLLSAASAQLVFTNASANLSHAGHAGACVAVVDMDGDGLDDIVQLDMSQHVYVLYQNPDHTFETYDYGQVENSDQWGWAIADLSNDGHKDICSGVGIINFVNITSRGVFTLSDLNGPNIFVQCMTMADFNNDSRVDVFACNDVGPSNIWITNGGGTPVYDPNVMPWATPACTGVSGDMSGNYGSTATDFDNDGDIDLHISHCRQGVNDPDDCRRWDRLFVNDGAGNYSDQAAAYGLENHEQVWTTDFGDYDNDGDLDAFQTTHSSTLMLQENDGTGHFTNVTAGSGLEITGFFLQAKMEDMDNDGFLDILTGSAEHFFKGNGDGTFTEINNLFPASKDILSFAFGDLNGDGFQDVYAGYGDGYVDGDPGFPDRLWLNTPNGNHWLNVKLKGVQSNRDAVGARVTITGPWGTMIREVHAGESYGIVNSFTCHFGLGTYTNIPTLTINWPSGVVDTYTNIAVDQVITAIEDECISPTASITPSGALVVCTGGSALTLTANPGFVYTWSTGETTQSIDVVAGGTYTVTIDDGTGCTGIASITVQQDPDETPIVSLNNNETFCEGDEVILTSTPAGAYLWSNSATTQSITVNSTGSYSVTVDGTCGDYVSEVIDITVLDAPDVAPTSSDVFLPAPGTADLTATGANVMWYDVPSGGAPIGAGSPWTTPFLNSTTTFWCADVTEYLGAEYYGAKTNNDAGNGAYFTNNAFYLLFTANEDMVIRSVKVYADGAGNRTIGVVNQSNGTTLVQGTFNIPDGESRVQLDFTVPAGGPYGMRVMTGAPDMWRDDAGATYSFPYALGTLGEVFATNATGGSTYARWYYFYDWEVEQPSYICAGPSTAVVVDVAVGMGEGVVGQGMSIWPNPTENQLNIEADEAIIAAELCDIAGRIVGIKAGSAGSTILNLDVSGLATGEYLLRVRTTSLVAQQRIMVR